MGIINLLDTEVSNKIAAGEVVERPASVVKELVENSIDAGATKITVEIKNGGNTFIKVSDNGCGMEKDDAATAFLRHATSKIKNEDDLNAIYTLGFRGEALSSIGAVAKVDLYTKRSADELGIHTVCEGGEIISEDDAGVPDGTTFIVKELFYNVPARMKFLKKDATEAGYISDIMTRFILSHPEISFKLINSGKPVLNSYGDGKIINCIYSVYGKDYASAMIPVNFETENVRVDGMCGKGSTARPNRSYQSFFINGRYIKSPLIMRAVEEAYKNQVMIGKFPVAVLNLEINPAFVDINVHPTKLEVKFSNESVIYQAVYHAVKEALYRISDIPKIKTFEKAKKESALPHEEIIKGKQLELELKETAKQLAPELTETAKQPLTPVTKPEAEQNKNDVKITESNTIGQSEEQAELEAARQELKKALGFDKDQTVSIASPDLFANRMKAIKTMADSILTENGTASAGAHTAENAGQAEPKNNTASAIQKTAEEPPVIRESESVKEINFRLVGQLFDTYIIIELDNEMRIIDQHAAHERLNYEELRKEAENRSIYSQGLAIPVVVKLSSTEFPIFEQNADFISSLGFEAEDYGGGNVIIRSIPNAMVSDDIPETFVEIVQQLADNKREIITEKKERLLYTIACKAAIKANHRLDEKEQTELVKKVLRLDNINTCPHGRPIMMSMTKKDIEKNFRRIV